MSDGPAHGVRLTVNGAACEARVDERSSLAEFVRDELGLTGTHVGCDAGHCGACTVLADGRAIRSCLLLAVQADGMEIVTVEGLGQSSTTGLHPLQQAFIDHAGVQCGFCTPGVLMTMQELLSGTGRPSREQVRQALLGNVCRCGGYQNMIDAVLAAAGDEVGDAAKPALQPDRPRSSRSTA